MSVSSLIYSYTLLLYLSFQAHPSAEESSLSPVMETIHEPRFLSVPPLLPTDVIDAFGLPAGGASHSYPDKTKSPEEPPPVSLKDVASRLHLQGINSGGEIIINTFLLTQEGALKIKMGKDSFEIKIKEIHENTVLIGWNQSDSTYLLSLPELGNPVTPLANSVSLSLDENEVILPALSAATGEESNAQSAYFHNNLHP